MCNTTLFQKQLKMDAKEKYHVSMKSREIKEVKWYGGKCNSPSDVRGLHEPRGLKAAWLTCDPSSSAESLGRHEKKGCYMFT